MKRKIIIALSITVLVIVCCYTYKSYKKQRNKDEKIICDCRKNGINTQISLISRSFLSAKTKLFFNNKKIDYKQQQTSHKDLVITFNLALNKSSKDTLFVKDNSKTIKIYNFDVDTLIINKKQGIICDLKAVTVDGKKQYISNLISLD